MSADFSPVRPGDAFVIGMGLFGLVLGVNEERGIALVRMDSDRMHAEASLALVASGRDALAAYEVTPELLEAQYRLEAAKERYGLAREGQA